ncbi:GPN-loop GTPase 1 [Frankliniella fusca]|uniref:GPN-loop GTPase 1 n=1 Tax=Frankliniella fusca TaxID=407009 RepID=A0AAE1L911_9NEOP|nr:GPN-loop GTPase 1 [Frankliniella fusca]
MQCYGFLTSGGQNKAATALHESLSEWKKNEYSRTSRTKRKLEDAALDCSKITDYFKILSDIEILVKQNEQLREQLVKNMTAAMNFTSSQPPKLSYMLELLLESAKTNAGKKAGGERYDNVIKELGHILFHVGGLQLYEILCKNLPLPSVSTIRRVTYKTDVILEGVFRFKELEKFLQERNLPLKVIMSEDGTVVAQRIQYHSSQNQIVGFTLPLDENGVPIIGAFPATSAKQISDYFSENCNSSNAYCIVAQPLHPAAPSFVVAMFGTNNKFVSEQVHKRWQWMVKEARKEGIEIVGFSSDGDSRLLKCMKFNVMSPTPDKNWSWFQSKRKVPFICVQDHIHIGNKLKSRLLARSIILPFGNIFLASSGHLLELIEKHKVKDHTLLEISDLNPRDKMNFAAMQKLCDTKVTDFLRKEIHGSEATAMYLDMMREVVESFTSLQLTPLTRVKMLWKWLFFLRFWRAWISDTPGYTLESNFVTSNAYQCIELNAHALIHVITNLRDSEDHNLFLPWLISSQPCEATFRILRSSQVSFSVLEMQHALRRIDMVTSSRLKLEGKINFPRHHKAIAKCHFASHVPLCLPEDYEIEKSVSDAFSEAVENAQKVGLLKKSCSKKYTFPSAYRMYISSEDMNMHDDEKEEDDDEDLEDRPGVLDTETGARAQQNDVSEDSDGDIEDVMEDLLIICTGSIGIKTFNDVNVTDTCPFVRVADGNGNPAVIRKSSLCWLLRSGDTKISADRLLRVQARAPTANYLYRTEAKTTASREDYVSVSDWCAFKSEDGSTVIGRILAFRYMTGHSRNNQVYSKLEAPTTAPEKNARGLGCLCSWFKVSKNLTLTSISMDIHGYYDIENYLCSIPRPRVLGNQLKLVCSLKDIKLASIK